MLAIAVIAFRYFWLAAPWLVPPSAVGGDPSVADKIAAASALFSILAFVGLLYTILLQRDELLSQREDQEQLHAEVVEQRHYLKAQAEALTQQAFENTFFHLLRLHNDNVRSQTYTPPPQTGGTTLVGRRAFTAAAAELMGTLAEYKRQFDTEMDLEEFNHMYSAVCERDGAHFGHYFRNLYHIVKYVDESAVPDKKRYTAQVRAQLSQPEYEVLFCNGLRRQGKSKFKPLIERYALLHEMRMNAFLANYSDCYDQSAFGVSEPAA